MPHPYSLAMSALVAMGLTLALAGPAVPQGPKKIQQPSWSHAFDLKCRKSTEPKFDKDTKIFGVEVYRDDNNGKGLYIMETGVIGAVPDLKDFKGVGVKSRTPAWLHGLDLRVRPAGVEDWSKAKTFGLEAFRDENTGDFIYISEIGTFSVAPGARGLRSPTESPKGPEWIHGLDLKVRKGGEKDANKDTKVWSIEVFLDQNTGTMIYLCESGSLAIVPGFKDAAAPTQKVEDPALLHGLDFKVRKGGQTDDAEPKKFGVEVFRDENNGNLIFISETGSLAVVPGKKELKAPTDEKTLQGQPVWAHGLDLKCRESGKKDFTKDTPYYGIEVFNDNATGCTVYICETGAITAVPKR